MSLYVNLRGLADDELVSARDHVADQIQALRQLHAHLSEALNGEGTAPAHVDDLLVRDQAIAAKIVRAKALLDAAQAARL